MTLIPILIIGVWGTKGQIGEGLYIFTGKMQYWGQKNIEKKCCTILDTKMRGIQYIGMRPMEVVKSIRVNRFILIQIHRQTRFMQSIQLVRMAFVAVVIRR